MLPSLEAVFKAPYLPNHWIDSGQLMDSSSISKGWWMQQMRSPLSSTDTQWKYPNDSHELYTFFWRYKLLKVKNKWDVLGRRLLLSVCVQWWPSSVWRGGLKGWMARWAMAGNMWGEVGMLTAGSQHLLFDHHFYYAPTVRTPLIAKISEDKGAFKLRGDTRFFWHSPWFNLQYIDGFHGIFQRLHDTPRILLVWILLSRLQLWSNATNATRTSQECKQAHLGIWLDISFNLFICVSPFL